MGAASGGAAEAAEPRRLKARTYQSSTLHPHHQPDPACRTASGVRHRHRGGRHRIVARPMGRDCARCCAIAVVLLIPWKGTVVRRGLRRARRSRWASLLLAAAGAGGHLRRRRIHHRDCAFSRRSAGACGRMSQQPWRWSPLADRHVLARSAPAPRLADLSCRVAAFGPGARGAAAAGIYVATGSVVRLADAAGTRRRFTGSTRPARSTRRPCRDTSGSTTRSQP